MISLTALLLGLINIAIVVLIMVLLGAIVLWVMGWIGFAVPVIVQRLYLAIVGLIALYMLVSLLLGMPVFNVVRISLLDYAAEIALASV